MSGVRAAQEVQTGEEYGPGICVDENSGVVYALQMEYGKDRVLLRKV